MESRIGLALLFVGSCISCASRHDIPPDATTLAGGETTYILNCLESRSLQPNSATAVFEPEECDSARLRGIRFIEAPPPLRISAECDHRLVHLNSEDYRISATVPLAEDGSFESDYGFLFHYEGQAQCQSAFAARLRGRIDCATETPGGVRSADIESEWTETSDRSGDGCPTTRPCRFLARSRLECVPR